MKLGKFLVASAIIGLVLPAAAQHRQGNQGGNRGNVQRPGGHQGGQRGGVQQPRRQQGNVNRGQVNRGGNRGPVVVVRPGNNHGRPPVVIRPGQGRPPVVVRPGNGRPGHGRPPVIVRPRPGQGRPYPVPVPYPGNRIQTNYVTCNSISYASNACYHGVGRVTGVTVSRHRGGRCVYGRDWSYNSSYIYVANGCRATFRVSGLRY